MPTNPDLTQPDRLNTISMLGQAYSLLGFQIVDGVVGAGFPQKPKHSAVFSQIDPQGSRLTDLARRANITPQAMGELIDELEDLGHVTRRPHPSDRRAKLVVLTANGQAATEAGRQTMAGLENRIIEILGKEVHGTLREMLAKLLAEGLTRLAPKALVRQQNEIAERFEEGGPGSSVISTSTKSGPKPPKPSAGTWSRNWWSGWRCSRITPK